MRSCVGHVAAVLTLAALLRPVAAEPLPQWLEIGDLTAVPMPAPSMSEARVQEAIEQGHGMVVELLRREIILRRDGTALDRITEVRRFVSEQGVQSDGNFVFPVNLSRARARIGAAYVVTPDGARVPIERDTVRVVNPSQVPIFTDLRWVVVPLRGLTPGARALMVSEAQRRRDALPIPWGSYTLTSASVPMERVALIVEWEEGVPAPSLRPDDPQAQCRQTGRRWECERTHSAAVMSDPQAINGLDLVSHVSVAEQRTWAELAAEVNRLVEDQIGDGAAVRSAALELTRGKATDSERVEALFRFVADQVRYVALAEGVNAVVPNPPRVTLDRRFGDCKDKTTLFIALARQAGMQAQPVLVGMGRQQPERLVVPNLAYFDHMIVCVRTEEGCTYLDPTVAFAPVGTLPPQMQGAVALDLGAADPQPYRLPEVRFVWDLAVDETNDVGCDGAMGHRARWTLSGPGALAIRGAYAAVPASDRARAFAAFYREATGLVAEPTVAFRGLDSPESHVEIDVEWRHSVGSRLGAYDAYRSADHGLILAAAFGKVEDWPHDMQQPGVRLMSRARYNVCPEVPPTADGPELDFSAARGSLRRTYQGVAGGVEAETTLELPRAMLSPPEVKRYRELIGRFLEQGTVFFSLGDGQP